MRRYEEIRPQRVTMKDITPTWTVEISSVNYRVGELTLDETCIFYPDGQSDVVGTYDDHDKIVDSFHALVGSKAQQKEED